MDRKDWIQKRKQILLRDEKNRAIAQKILPFFKDAKCIGYYSPIRQEADILSSRDPSQPIALPRVLDSTTMKFYEARDMKPGVFGILEPQGTREIVPDVLVIPMLCFCDGYRIGYGGGYYDRYLKKHPKALRIGIAFDEQEGDFTPEPWDERLDYIITPTRILHYPDRCPDQTVSTTGTDEAVSAETESAKSKAAEPSPAENRSAKNQSAVKPESRK